MALSSQELEPPPNPGRFTIGFLVGILHYFFATSTLPPALADFTDGSLTIRQELLDVLSEHAAPRTLTYGLFSVLAFVFVGRILFGSASIHTARFSDRLVFPLFKFNLTLASAMTSLIVGLALSALVFGYFLVSLAFLAYALFPILCAALLSASVRLSFPLACGTRNFDDGPVVSRLVGLFSLFIFVIVLLVWPYIERFLSWAMEVIKHGS